MLSRSVCCPGSCGAAAVCPRLTASKMSCSFISSMEFIQPLAGFMFDGPGVTSGVLSLDLFGFGSWNSPCSSMYCHVSASAQTQALEG